MTAEVFPSTNRGGKTNQYQLRVRIPLDLHKELIQLAADEGISQSDYMVRLLQDFLFDKRRQDNTEKAISEALDELEKPCTCDGLLPRPSCAVHGEFLESSRLMDIALETAVSNPESVEFQPHEDDLMAVLRSRR